MAWAASWASRLLRLVSCVLFRVGNWPHWQVGWAVPLAAFVELDSGEASDHQPLVVDFEAVAFDAGE